VAPNLSVVIPMYDEQEVLPLLVARLRPVLDALKSTYEVIAVDDGSGDLTPALLQKTRREWPQLRVIRLRASDVNIVSPAGHAGRPLLPSATSVRRVARAKKGEGFPVVSPPHERAGYAKQGLHSHRQQPSRCQPPQPSPIPTWRPPAVAAHQADQGAPGP